MSERFKGFAAESTFIQLSEREDTSRSALGNKPKRHLDLFSVPWYGVFQISMTAIATQCLDLFVIALCPIPPSLDCTSSTTL